MPSCAILMGLQMDLTPAGWACCAGSAPAWDALRDATLYTAALLVLLVVMMAVARGLMREWRLQQMQARAAAELMPADSLRAGLPAIVEAPTGGGLLRGRLTIQAVERKLVTLALPMDADEPDMADVGAVAAGTPVCVTVAGDTAAFRFHASVQDRAVVAGVRTLYVSRPAWVEKIQRREHFRIPVALPAAVSTVEADSRDSRLMRGVVEDLSGGGCRVALPEAQPDGSWLRIRLSDDGLGDCSLEARVVRCEPTRRFGPLRCAAQCEFVYLTEETQNRIVLYCFDAERRRARTRDEG